MSHAPDVFDDPFMGEPYLLTPIPLTTSRAVKEAMLKDWGSWDGDFRAVTRAVCEMLVDLAGGADGVLDCVPMQGSGSFMVEAVLASFVPHDGKVLVLANGTYGLRIAQTMDCFGPA